MSETAATVRSHVDGDLVSGNWQETELGLLPQEWQVGTLDEIARLEKVTLNPQHHPGEMFEYYSIPAYLVGRQPLLEAGAEIHSQKLLIETGKVLFGKLNPRVPKVWLVSASSARRKIASTEFIPLAPLGNKATSEFLYYLCWSDVVMGPAQELVSGSTPSRQRVDVSAFRSIRVPIPPLPEQHAIAHVLRTVQQAKEATDAVIAATRELKKSLMRHLFTYGPVPVDQADQVPLKETEIGPVPEYWRVVCLKDIADLASGGTPSKKRTDWWAGRIPWASPKDLKTPRLHDTQDHITEEAALSSSRITPKGSLLVVVRGMILAKDIPISMTAVPMAFNQDVKSILPRTDAESEYLLYALVAFKTRLSKDIGTSAHGTRRIGTTALERWMVPLPPAHEQRAIAEALATVDRKLDAEETKGKALNVLFTAVLHHLMTGKVRVHHSAVALEEVAVGSVV